MLHFIDHPFPIPRENYHDAIQDIVENNKNLPFLRSIYKFGNITSPGISDLDILFVFENKQSCLINGFEGLSTGLKKIFTHGIMGICVDDFIKMDYYALWGTKELMFGSEITCNKQRTEKEENLLKTQTALEFLLANYVDLQIQLTYSTIKLRSFLQHMKGLLYDLELLGETNGPLHETLSDLKDTISYWFKSPQDLRILQQWIKDFVPLYFDYIDELFSNTHIQLPRQDQYTIASNMRLVNGAQIQMKHKGLVLPAVLSFAGRKYFKLQHRLNYFTFSCPIQTCIEPFLLERFEFIKNMKAYNRSMLPNFMTNTTSITSKIF